MNFKKINALILGLVLIFGPASVLASGFEVSITSPTDGAEFKVGQVIEFTGQATGGDNTTYAFNWSWGDGQETSSENDGGQTSVNKTYNQTGEVTVELRVTDIEGNTNTDQINLTIVEDTEDLTISNIQVSNITQTGATITWQTNLPADSRVIYDTVSRLDISEAEAPNFGYANSTATYNQDSRVTSHSVNLTGLNPGTRYYFRVLSRSEI